MASLDAAVENPARKGAGKRRSAKGKADDEDLKQVLLQMRDMLNKYLGQEEQDDGDDDDDDDDDDGPSVCASQPTQPPKPSSSISDSSPTEKARADRKKREEEERKEGAAEDAKPKLSSLANAQGIEAKGVDYGNDAGGDDDGGKDDGKARPTKGSKKGKDDGEKVGSARPNASDSSSPSSWVDLGKEGQGKANTKKPRAPKRPKDDPKDALDRFAGLAEKVYGDLGSFGKTARALAGSAQAVAWSWQLRDRLSKVQESIDIANRSSLVSWQWILHGFTKDEVSGVWEPDTNGGLTGLADALASLALRVEVFFPRVTPWDNKEPVRQLWKHMNIASNLVLQLTEWIESEVIGDSGTGTELLRSGKATQDSTFRKILEGDPDGDNVLAPGSADGLIKTFSSLDRAATQFNAIESPALAEDQAWKAKGLDNLAVIATFFASVVVQATSWNLPDDGNVPLERATNTLVYASLVLSISSAITAVFGSFWMLSPFRSASATMPWFVHIWVTTGPIVFLVASVGTFFAGMVCFLRLIPHSNVAFIVSLVLVALSAVAFTSVAAWNWIERRAWEEMTPVPTKGRILWLWDIVQVYFGTLFYRGESDGECSSEDDRKGGRMGLSPKDTTSFRSGWDAPFSPCPPSASPPDARQLAEMLNAQIPGRNRRASSLWAGVAARRWKIAAMGRAESAGGAGVDYAQTGGLPSRPRYRRAKSAMTVEERQRQHAVPERSFTSGDLNAGITASGVAPRPPTMTSSGSITLKQPKPPARRKSTALTAPLSSTPSLSADTPPSSDKLRDESGDGKADVDLEMGAGSQVENAEEDAHEELELETLPAPVGSSSARRSRGLVHFRPARGKGE